MLKNMEQQCIIVKGLSFLIEDRVSITINPLFFAAMKCCDFAFKSTFAFFMT